jgi:hypothetical protein
MERWSVHAAELIGVLYVINIINNIALRHWITPQMPVQSATILSDSRPALQAVQSPGNNSGQLITHFRSRQEYQGLRHIDSTTVDTRTLRSTRERCCRLTSQRCSHTGTNTPGFAFCCHAREHTLGKGSTLNGRRNGASQPPAPISV